MVSKSKNAQSLYVIKSVFKNGKRSTKIVEKLGTYNDLLEKLKGKTLLNGLRNILLN